MYHSMCNDHHQILRSAPRWSVAAASATSVARARRQAGDTLAGWGLPSAVVEDAVLVASELVTNAVRHGTGPVWHTLRLCLLADGAVLVRLMVGDGGPGCGVAWTAARGAVPGADPIGTSGRGLGIVDALTTAWGSVSSPTGHHVWAELRAGCPAAADPVPEIPDGLAGVT